jgi:putative transposase
VSVAAVSVAGVKQVVKVRMLPTQEQAAALGATLLACNETASWSSGMHAERVRRKHEAQKRFYTEVKQRFGLSAQPAIRVIGKVADAYTTLKANLEAGNYGPPGSAKRTKVAATPIGFRTEAAQPFDARCLSWQIPEVVGGREATVSIWTTACRLKGVRVLAAPHDLVLLRTRPIGETDLIRRDGKWYLYATVEAPETPRTDPVNGFLGVDLGIVNIATSSDGDRAAGARLNRYRKRQQRLRARYRRRTTGGDPARVRLRKLQRAAVHSWAFAQLGGYLGYKAQQAGVVSVKVDPAYTSQTCSACGWVDKRNRRSQAEFDCGRCGFVGHADHNAAIVIAQRGVERWGEVMRPYAAQQA